jgi:signal transduction histidine kinase
VPKTKILIVEDEAVVALDLRHRLEQLGYTVSGVAGSGVEAISEAGATRPDVVLMDIKLRGAMDGVEVAEELRTRFDLPVVYLTAYADDATLERVKAAGPFGYLLKPFEGSELRVTIEIALYKHAAERRMRDYAAALEARNRELDAFSHTVAHDLKNPLATIIGFADLLLKQQSILRNEDLSLCVQNIETSSRKMENVINELLLLAEVRQGDVETQPLDMAGIVDAARKRLSHIIERRQAQIVLPQAWPVALGHGPWVEQVWINYLSNAIKYGGDPPRLELGAEVSEDVGLPHAGARFWVRDNGPGLAEEQRGRLFLPFTRLDQARARGHGLGLSIVRRIVERLDGDVGVESEPGQGSRFYFVLPLANGAQGPERGP